LRREALKGGRRNGLLAPDIRPGAFFYKAGLLGGQKIRANASMMHLVQSLGLPHWLMLAGALLVIAGCLGLAISRKKAAEIDDEPVNETSPEPPP